MASVNGTANGMGSASTRYTIQTEHYNGNSNAGSALDVIPKDAPYTALRSLYGESPNFSFAHPPGIGLQNWHDLGEYNITYHAVGDKVVIRPNAAGPNATVSIKDLEKYGAMVVSEETMENMDSWLAVKSLVKYVRQPAKNGILIEGPETETPYSKFSEMPDVNIYIKPMFIDGAIRINDFGKMLSASANTDEHVRNFLFTNDMPNYDMESGDYTYIREGALNWARFLLSKQIDKVREVKGTGSGDLSDMQANAVTIYRSFLALANDLHQTAWKQAEALGLKGREAQEYVTKRINSALEHELYHFLEPDRLSEKASETRAGKLQSEHYSQQAELKKGTVEGRVYSILAKYYAAYAKAASKGKFEKSALSRLETLAKEYETEARALGLKEGEIGDYVEKQLESYAEKEIRDSNKTNSEETAKEGDLEAKASSSKDAPAEAETDGNPAAESDADSGESEGSGKSGGSEG